MLWGSFAKNFSPLVLHQSRNLLKSHLKITQSLLSASRKIIDVQSSFDKRKVIKKCRNYSESEGKLQVCSQGQDDHKFLSENFKVCMKQNKVRHKE